MERTPLYNDGGPVLRISYPLLPLDAACSFELRSPLSIPPSSFHPSFFHPSSFHPSSFHHSKSTGAPACVAAPRDAGCAFALSPAVACGPRSFSILKSTCAPACVATPRDAGCAFALSPAVACGPREEEKPGGLGEATPERVREARNPPVCCVEERGDGVKPTHAWRRPVWYPRDGEGVGSGLRCRPLFPRL